MTERISAGELSHKAMSDTTKYDALEVGHAVSDDLDKHLRDSIELYRDRIDQNEFCVAFVIAEDPLIKNLKRRKFYCWPFLPSPRPNQSVFLYNKGLDRITKRLWVLPSAQVMAELTQSIAVHERYKTMQAWSAAFFAGTFWDYIRYEHNITMLSEHEYHLAHPEKFTDARGKQLDAPVAEAFDFSKITINKIIDTKKSVVDQDLLQGCREAQTA